MDMEIQPAPMSSSESLTSRSTESMEIDGLSVLENSPPRSDSPLNDTLNSLNAEDDKGIIVERPSILADTSTMIVDNDEDEEEEVVTPYHKRKRQSINYNLDGEVVYKAPRANGEDRPKRSKTKQPNVRGVIIGVWRDSDQPDDKDKHVIFGFIDIHDRLRTRIYAMNRKGEELIGNAPTGAGGCWVTFERVIFDSHLRDLTPAEVKEYVKLRSETDIKGATSEETQEADAKAVIRAKQIAAANEASPQSKPIVHRSSMGRSSLNRQPTPRQSIQTLHKTPSFQAVNAADYQTPKHSPLAENKIHGVLLGFWKESDQVRDADKHAVFGVLSGADQFRIKVQRVTRDGRFVDGNFPSGAGALWLHYDSVVLEPHLRVLTRPEVKEYCRIRQGDLQNRESEKERKANETKAVEMAKAYVQQHGLNIGNEIKNQFSEEPEIRHSARSEQRQAARNQAQAEVEAERQRAEKVEARERQNEKTRKEVAAAEAAVNEAAQKELQNNLKKLNKVWVAQQAATLPQTMVPANPSVVAGFEQEVRYHNGIKYELKQNGLLQGKLVNQAQILRIDGEDYLEYRILTKSLI